MEERDKEIEMEEIKRRGLIEEKEKKRDGGMR